MSFVCNLCHNVFAQKNNLNKHLDNKRCKTGLIMDHIKLNNHISDITKLQNRIKTQEEKFTNILQENYKYIEYLQKEIKIKENRIQEQEYIQEVLDKRLSNIVSK